MKETFFSFSGGSINTAKQIKVYCFEALIAGAGAAGLNAADTLHTEGVRDIAIITDDIKGGTSRNAGSDKQTYYKLSLGGGDQDSVRALAQTLFSGGCMDGDIALAEAAGSVPCFTNLARLGVPFPRNRYGEYAGYKTDHDPYRRAASAGPYTSKFMTEALEGQVKAKKIKIFSSMQIVKILTIKNETAGLLCLNLKALEKSDDRFVIFLSPSIVWATGGPADIYGSSVYPAGQHGAQGAAFEAGAAGRNLTEWQYGLASVKPRWNVSGTYMQALPRFVSVDPADKNDKGQEFLLDYFASPGEMLSTVFLKGYQWPFDTRKLTGSSLIDVLVYNELRQGRKVYLDFRQNPLGNNAIDYAALSPEAGNYLKAAGACFGNPFQRLEKMNRPAIDFYLDKGVDLKKDLLEISLSAQHNNGGLAVNLWWQSNLKGLFPAGEAAGTHGVYRPGGSALNSGQAGSFRAALYIARQGKHENKNPEILKPYLEKQILEVITLADKIIETKCDTVTKLTKEVQSRMSLSGGPFRNEKAIKDGLKEAKALLKQFPALAGVSSAKNLHRAFRLRDILISQVVYLSAMEDYIAQGGGSRGSALYYHNDGEKPQKNLPDVFRTKSPDNSHDSLIQEVSFKNSRVKITYRERNPIPADDDFFENVWRTYRENGNVI